MSMQSFFFFTLVMLLLVCWIPFGWYKHKISARNESKTRNMIWDRYTTESVGTYFRTSDLAAFVEQTIQTKGFLLTLWNSCKDKQHRRTIVPILRPIRDNPCLSQSCERIVMCKRVCLRASCWVNLWYSMTKAWTCHPHTHTMGE